MEGEGKMTEMHDEMLEMMEDTQKDRYLTFDIGKEAYGIEIINVTEIIGFQPITEVPDLPDYIKGIINLRGKIIPVMDVRLRFKKPPLEYNDRTCVIVVDIQNISVGLIVDAVAEVMDIPERDVVPPPQLNRDHQNKYIKAIGKVGNEVKLLIDCDKLLSDDELENLNDMKEQNAAY
jgi:purine-binding chemotaxis protein CheW